VNEQYLGDERDFVKYDFLLHFARSLDLSDGVTIIPMLTTPRGRKAPSAYEVGARDESLHTLLHSIASSLDLTYCQAAEEIADFSASRGFPVGAFRRANLRPVTAPTTSVGFLKTPSGIA
jgi:hypothetical protein